MAGESGGELGAAMLGVAMLDDSPIIFALEVVSGCIASGAAEAIQKFITAAQSNGVGQASLQALQAFIAQGVLNGVGQSGGQVLLVFPVQQVGAGGIGGISLDAWLQMLHAQGDLSQMLIQIGAEDRLTVQIYFEQYAIQIEMNQNAIEIDNTLPMVTI